MKRVLTMTLRVPLYGLALVAMGCASDQARYVYQDHESGVIAIPRNTPRMMAYAEKLMEKHFPGQNYEVVRTVEVETGGSRATYESASTEAKASAGRLGILGGGRFSRDRDRKQAESTKMTEARIVYHQRQPGGPTELAFAQSPDFTPKVYSDAVVEELLPAGKMKATQLAKVPAPRTKDHTVLPVAGPIDPIPLPTLGGKPE